MVVVGFGPDVFAPDGLLLALAVHRLGTGLHTLPVFLLQLLLAGVGLPGGLGLAAENGPGEKAGPQQAGQGARFGVTEGIGHWLAGHIALHVGLSYTQGNLFNTGYQGRAMHATPRILAAAALMLLCVCPAWPQSRPNNASPELGKDQDDNVPDIIAYIVQQRTQWDFDMGSPEARAFTQLLNFGKTPCLVLEGRIIPSLVGDGFQAECRCSNGTLRLLDYDDKRVYTERLYIDHLPYELPEIYVKKPEADEASIFKVK